MRPASGFIPKAVSEILKAQQARGRMESQTQQSGNCVFSKIFCLYLPAGVFMIEYVLKRDYLTNVLTLLNQYRRKHLKVLWRDEAENSTLHFLVLTSCNNNIPQTGWLMNNRTTFFFSHYGGRDVQDQGADSAWFSTIFLLCPHMVERVWVSLGPLL